MARMWRSVPGPRTLQTGFSMKQVPWRMTNFPSCETVPTLTMEVFPGGTELWFSQIECQSFHRSLHLSWFQIKPLPRGHVDCLVQHCSGVSNGGFRDHWFCLEITAANYCQGCLESAQIVMNEHKHRVLSSSQLTGSFLMHVGRGP